MTVQAEWGDAAAREAAFAEAHRQLLADSAVQFELARAKAPEIPTWLVWLGELIAAAFPVLRILFFVMVGAAALFILYLIGRRIAEAWWPRRTGGESAEDEEEPWRPEAAPARALLAEADLLASEGRFSQAAHLLLFRSIEEIEGKRPNLVKPALTSRDIAGAEAIPGRPREAFRRIVSLVERSLFGGRALGREDWDACRAAYEEFAFREAWRA